MKLIISRKGFDTSAGGVPSPIFPDGRMVSLPIPGKQSPICYSDISFDGNSIAPIVSSLTRGRFQSYHGAHLDPDLSSESLKRHHLWKPIFGQSGAAQGHLDNNGVQAGDLFLFFGLFRRTVNSNGHYMWVKESLPVHVIWGWLQIGEVLPLDNYEGPYLDWAAYHPHFHCEKSHSNCLYISSTRLKLEHCPFRDLPGAGIFTKFSAGKQLTGPNANRPSLWELPSWFYPCGGRKPLTYHNSPDRWRKINNRTELKVASRGQEFILDCDDYPEAFQWLGSLFAE